MPILFDEVQCTGAERSLGQCSFITDHDCDHSEEAGVICIGILIFLCMTKLYIHIESLYIYVHNQCLSYL